MKKKFFVFVAALACMALFSANKTPDEENVKLKTADKLNREAKSEEDLREAFRLFSELAQEGDKVAILRKGEMYQKGKGVEKNNNLAMECFIKASELGNPHATAAIGSCYLRGNGVKQNFEKAREWYQASIDKGKSCIGQYGLGMLYFKGMGGEQNYEKAFELFSASALANNVAGNYMVGYCYLFGYGVEKDEATGLKYLRKIKRWGSTVGNNELLEHKYRKTEAFSPFVNSDIPDFLISPVYEPCKAQMGTSALSGNYEGLLITYDWSGSKIEYTNKIALSLSGKGDSVFGTWIENDTLKAKIAAKIENNTLTFKKSAYKRYDRSIPFNPEKYSLKTATFEVLKKNSEEFITGNIHFWLTVYKEPSRPSSFVLRKITEQENKTSLNILDLKFFPVPVSDILEVQFSALASDVANVEIRNKNGELVYSSKLEIKAGQNGFKVSTPWEKGIYVLSISNDNLFLSKKFVKH